MNIASIMDKLPYTYVLVFCCLTLVCSDRKAQDLSSSCEVELRVQRSTTWTAAPHEHLSVSCPVKHCGNSVNITWCKLDHTNKCEQMNYTEDIEIQQDDSHYKDEVTSFLTFKQISINDSGLYRCCLRGSQNEISHTINISVSDVHQGVTKLDNNKDKLQSAPEDEHVSWRAILSLFVSIALLLITLVMLAYLSLHGFKRTLAHHHTKTQETPTHMIPGLPGQSAPCSLVMQSHPSTLKDVCSPNTAESRPKPPAMTSGSKHQASDHAVYAVINYQQSKTTAKGQRAETGQKTNSEYATIKHF